MFEVKKKARRLGEDDLTFPEPLDPINFDKPKHGLNSEDKTVNGHRGWFVGALAEENVS